MKKMYAAKQAGCLVAAVCFLALLLGLLPLPSAAAEESPQQIVRVGYYYDGDFLYKDENGVYQGYDAEYLYEVAKYTNWVYQFVDFDSFDDALSALTAGEIDIIPDLFQTPERQQKLLFSSDNMGKLYVTLLVPSTDQIHSYNDMESFSGMKVGVLSGSVDGKNFRAWDQNNQLHCKIVEMASVEELMSALDAGQVDGVAITYMGPSNKQRIVAEFAPEYLYFGMPKDRTKLMAELNSAMDQIAARNPEFRTALYQKYLTIKNEETPAFTQEELRYIANSGPICVALSNDSPPFSFLDDKGNFKGAIPDLFARISQLSGLEFTFAEAETQDQAIQNLQTGSVQVIGKLTENAPLMAAQKVRLTDPYMDLFMNMITRKGEPAGNPLAVPVAVKSVYEEVQRETKDDTSQEAVYYPTAQACIQALDQKKVDAALCNSIFTNYLVNHSRASTYTVTALSGYSYRLCMGVRMTAEEDLYSILNKCVQNIDDAEMNEMVLRYSQEEDNSLSAILGRIPTDWLIAYAIILMVALLAAVLALCGLRKHMREEKVLIAQQEKVKQEAEMTARRTEFFGMASHDMRTPLNAILGFSGLAMDADNLDTVRQFLRKIQSAGTLLLELINDTLVIAKTDSKGITLHSAVVDGEELLDAVLLPIRAAAEKKGVSVHFVLPKEELGYIRVDPLYLQKVLLNLLSNAVQFTPSGGQVFFQLETKRQQENQMIWQVIIRDTGVGMSKEFQPKMFELFAQETADGNEGKGAGMGLAIVKRLVEAMHGTIAVRSEKGAGTEFTLSLPVELVPDYVPAAAREEWGDALKNRKILLCEDNGLNAEIVKGLLEKEHMDLVWAKNGREGVQQFAQSAQGEFAAILMDIRMPEMDGYEATGAIRRLPRGDAARIPILALSADAFDDDVAKAKQAGMNAHLAKPIQPEQLYRVLHRWITAQET